MKTFLFGEVVLPLCAWDGQHYFIVALPEPSIYLFFMKTTCRISEFRSCGVLPLFPVSVTTALIALFLSGPVFRFYTLFSI